MTTTRDQRGRQKHVGSPQRKAQPHQEHSALPGPRRLLLVAGILIAHILILLPATAMAAQDARHSLEHYPALNAFTWTTNEPSTLHMMVEPQSRLDQHKSLHAMCADARKRERSKHWVFPTIRSLSRIVTSHGVVVVEHSKKNTSARIIPTMSFNTVGAKLRVSF